MADNTKANISMIKKKVLVYSAGLIGKFTVDSGKTGNNMDMVLSSLVTSKNAMGFGCMESMLRLKHKKTLKLQDKCSNLKEFFNNYRKCQISHTLSSSTRNDWKRTIIHE